VTLSHHGRHTYGQVCRPVYNGAYHQYEFCSTMYADTTRASAWAAAAGGAEPSPRSPTASAATAWHLTQSEGVGAPSHGRPCKCPAIFRASLVTTVTWRLPHAGEHRTDPPVPGTGELLPTTSPCTNHHGITAARNSHSANGRNKEVHCPMDNDTPLIAPAA
jgi:hypothetical protein